MKCLLCARHLLTWVGMLQCAQADPSFWFWGPGMGRTEMELVGRPLEQTIMHDGCKQEFTWYLS